MFTGSKVLMDYRKITGGQRFERKRFLDYYIGDVDRSCHRHGHWQLLQWDIRSELAGLWEGIRDYQPYGAGFRCLCADFGADD